MQHGSPADSSRLIYAGMLGLTGAAITQLMGNDPLSVPQLVGVLAFAGAAPLLTVALLATYTESGNSQLANAIGLIGCIGAVVGLGGLFFHFGTWVGGVFVISTVLAWVLARLL